jgi:hypothetical protein
MPNGTYGGVRGKETKVGHKLSFPDLLDLLVCQNNYNNITARWAGKNK